MFATHPVYVVVRPPITEATTEPEEKSLYDRLGGIFAIAAVVDRFSDSLINNSRVGRLSSNDFLREWSTKHLDRLPGLKWMRTLWVADITGGPYKFVATRPGTRGPLSLDAAHCKFHITPEEFDVVAEELANALDYYHVPPREKKEVLQAFAAHKSEVTRGYFQPGVCPFLLHRAAQEAASASS